MKNPVFTGAGVAIITPMYEDGSVNFDELGRIIEDQIARGTDAIVICGTTGECSTMTDEEQLAAIKFTVDTVNHRVPVIAGAGSNDTTTAVHWRQSLPSAAQTPCCWSPRTTTRPHRLVWWYTSPPWRTPPASRSSSTMCLPAPA